MSTDDDIPMPEGNGDKDCPKCKGRGVVPMELDGWPGGGTQNCDCVFKRDLLINVKRVWKVILSVESVPDSPLLALTKKNVWLTASNIPLRRHLRFVAFRMGTRWDARVIADATLITAWLSTAKDVRDADVRHPSGEAQEFDGPPSDQFQTLIDLVAPFDLLIIRLGIKAAANKEMANVLAEALNERDMLGKPTWIVDSPARPLGPGHKCYSEDVLAILEDFERVVLQEEVSAVHGEASQYATKTASQAPAVPTQAMGASNYGFKSPSMQTMPLTPGPRRPSAPPVPAPDEDDDACSISALIADAVMPVLPVQEEDPEEDPEQFPPVDEVMTNGTPAWVAKRALTTEDRKTAEAQAKRDKRNSKKWGGK